ncbi:MAG: hypothetical protein ACOVRM_13885, partial [Planctomycetaceae bacterium]
MSPTPKYPFSPSATLATILLCCTVLINPSPGYAADEPGIVHNEYSGALIQPGDGDGQVLRRFEVQTIDSPASCFFHLSD